MRKAITRRWRHPAKRRYYCVYLSRNLWGDWDLTRCWGSLVSKQGRVDHQPCLSYVAALNILEAIAVRRAKRGYLENAHRS